MMQLGEEGEGGLLGLLLVMLSIFPGQATKRDISAVTFVLPGPFEANIIQVKNKTTWH